MHRQKKTKYVCRYHIYFVYLPRALLYKVKKGLLHNNFCAKAYCTLNH